MAVKIWPVMTGIEMRSSKSQKWNTTIEKAGSGRMRSNTNQLLPLWTIQIKYWRLTTAEYKAIMGFVALLKGAHEPFFWLDPEDNHETGIQLPSVGYGTYQCVMKFGNYVEAVDHVDQLAVYVDGVLQDSNAYTVVGGTVVFDVAPASGSVVTADYRYYWHVHFPADSISINHIITNFKQTGTLKFESWR